MSQSLFKHFRRSVSLALLSLGLVFSLPALSDEASLSMDAQASSQFIAELGVDRSLSLGLTDLVFELNKQTPIKVDADTRLDSVSTFSKFMIYNNTLTDLELEQVNPSLVAQHFEENMIEHLCSMDTFAPFIDLGLVMVYRYTDKNGKFITELSKDLSGCR